jgi:predicted Zn finger-like uncharacterized protein
MLTRCNHCEACFQINERLVRENDATVACGDCGNVFDARLNLVDEYSGEYYQLAEDIAEPEGQALAVGAGYDDLADSSFDQDSRSPSATWLPEENTQWQDPTLLVDEYSGLEAPYRDRQPQHTGDTDASHSEVTGQVASPPREDICTQTPVPPQDLPAIYLEDYPALANDLLEHKRLENTPGEAAEPTVSSDSGEARSSRSLASRASWILSIGLLLTGIVVAAIGYRDWIAQSSLPRPARALFCTVAGCELPLRRAVDQLAIVGKTSYTHPSVEGALIVSVDLLNSAAFSQPYPSLQVIMADENGRTVAQRDFSPSDYLAAELDGQLLVTDEPVRINLEIVDPGPSAKSFEIGLY